MPSIHPTLRFPPDVAEIVKHEGTRKDEVGLIVLGGPSAAAWKRIKKQYNPTCLIIANGANTMIEDPDFWVLAENMSPQAKLARTHDPRAIDFIKTVNAPMSPKTVRFVNRKSFHLLQNKLNAVSISFAIYEDLNKFNSRTYGAGFILGPFLRRTDTMKTPVRVGTVALQCLHIAAFLGLKQVHTIGLDLLYTNNKSHHWYKWPAYKPDVYRNDTMFTTFKGVKTQFFWIEAAEYLIKLYPHFLSQGMQWFDHSNGLLSLMKAPMTLSKEPHE